MNGCKSGIQSEINEHIICSITKDRCLYNSFNAITKEFTLKEEAKNCEYGGKK